MPGLVLKCGMAEKSINDLPRELRQLFTKASDALLRENYDYPIELFNQILAKEPAVYECRKALRTAQQKRGGGGSGFFKKAWSNATSSPGVAKARMALRKDPAEAMQLAEQILNTDPDNSSAHKIVVEAAAALDMPYTAVLSLEILARSSPKDKWLAIQFANALAGCGEGSRAEKVLQEFMRSMPNGFHIQMFFFTPCYHNDWNIETGLMYPVKSLDTATVG